MHSEIFKEPNSINKSLSAFSLGKTLTKQIHDFWLQLKETNALFIGARTGKTTALQASLLIENISYLIHFTPPFLQKAYTRSMKLEDEGLAQFFLHKMGEEEGHELWAEKDQKGFLDQFGIESKGTILISMRTLVSSISNWIDEDPKLYLGYILFAEYFTVIGSPEILSDFETKCQLPSSLFTVIGNHAELDKAHAIEMIEVIDRFATSQSDQRSLLEVVSMSCKLYDIFAETVGRYR